MHILRFPFSFSAILLLLIQLSVLAAAFDFELSAGGDAPAHLRGSRVLVRNNDKEVIIGASGKALTLRALNCSPSGSREEQLLKMIWVQQPDRALAIDPQERMMVQGQGRPYGELGFRVQEFKQRRWCQGPNNNLIRRFPSDANKNCPGKNFKPFTLSVIYK